MAGKYVVRKTHQGDFFFTLVGDDGEILLTGQPHPRREGALHAIAAVRLTAQVEKYYARKTASGGQLYFTLKTAHNQFLARSELFTLPAALEQNIQAAKRTAPFAPPPS